MTFTTALAGVGFLLFGPAAVIYTGLVIYRRLSGEG